MKRSVPVFGRRPSKSTADASPGRRTGGATAAHLVSEAERSGKGRPTPTRRDAEEARKQRLTPPRTRKEAAAAQRRKRSEVMAARREAIRSGDERYLPARDQGPVRRFARDYVDARWNAAEFLLPVLIIILVLSVIPQTAVLATLIWLLAIIAPLLDSVMLYVRLRTALKKAFPGESTRGALSYAVLRSTSLRRWRMPPAQVARGEAVQVRRR
jgi:hypothetical protein